MSEYSVNPVSVENHLINHLINSFLEESMAVKIVEKLKQRTEKDKMNICYGDLITAYPTGLIRSLEKMCDGEALDYLKQHHPKHFAIGIFSF